MSSTWTVSRDYCVEVWFEVEKDEDGYPRNVRWEQLLGYPVEEDVYVFEIVSVPFLLKNVSRGDVVRARDSTEPDTSSGFVFVEVLERGGHNTYRLWLEDPETREDVVRELVGKGLFVETRHDALVAVDVPSSVDQDEIAEYLANGKDAGRWDLQDGFNNGVELE